MTATPPTPPDGMGPLVGGPGPQGTGPVVSGPAPQGPAPIPTPVTPPNVDYSATMLSAPPSSIAPATIAQAGSKGKSNRITLILAGVLAAAVLFVGGFFTGRSTAPDNLAGGTTLRGGPLRAGGQVPDLDQMPEEMRERFESGDGQAFRSMARMQMGTITQVDGTSITIKSEDGTETTFSLDAETNVQTITTDGVDVLAVGDQVSVASDATEGETGGAARSITRGDMAGGGRFFIGGPGGEAPPQ